MASVDIGIDLGTANIMITMGNKGVVLNEPSVVAYNKKTQSIAAVGAEAYDMIGRTPEYIVAVRPLCDGVISDHSMTEAMIDMFIQKVCGKQLVKPRIIICIPSLITDVESRAVVEAARNSGSRKVYLIQEPIAALLGTGVDISKPDGHMVVDLGGGTTDVAVVSLNGIVKATSIKLAGSKLDASIIKYVTNHYKILIGEKTAEAAKINLANVFDSDGSRKMVIKGRHLIKGLPEKLEISDTDVNEAMREQVDEIVTEIKTVLEQTPPELVGDIYTNGIVLTGGGAMLGGLDKLIAREIGIGCHVAENPIACVARGTGLAFKYLDQLLDGFERIPLYNYR